MQASVGLSQLALIDRFIENRRAYCRFYNERFSDIEEIRVPATVFDDVASFIYFIRVPDARTRADLIAHMNARGVHTGIHFQGAHTFRFYADAPRSDLTVTETIADQQLTLPLHSFMNDRTLERVVDSVRSFFA